MKTPNLPLSNLETHFDKPDPEMETELARRMSKICIHAAGRILDDARCYAPFEYRQAYTAIVGGLNTIEQHLTDLALNPTE
jgi:hypothetical protein